MRFARSAVLAAVVALAASCGGGTSMTSSVSGGGNPPANQVFMQNTAFNPVSLTVTAGTTVTWTNQDAITHTVTYSSGPDSSFSSTVPAGSTFRHLFKTAGTYQYYCTIHGTPTTGMRGTIVAQ